MGSSLQIKGNVVLTPEAKQPFEIKASSIVIEGTSTPEYPLQKKRHTFEYLRTIAHLRPRTNTFSAVFRVRSLLAHAIHKFFRKTALSMCIPPSSPAATARAQKCSASPPGHEQPSQDRKRGRLIFKGFLQQRNEPDGQRPAGYEPMPWRSGKSTPSAPPSVPKHAIPPAMPQSSG